MALLRYATLIAPLLLRRGGGNPKKMIGGYAGGSILGILSSIFLLAALFTWVTKTYGLDAAFLVTGLVIGIGALLFFIMAKRAEKEEKRQIAERRAQLKSSLAVEEDPLAEHIPQELLDHPLSQKILLQIEDKPWLASASAISAGYLLSKQIFEDA